MVMIFIKNVFNSRFSSQYFPFRLITQKTYPQGGKILHTIDFRF